jgi:cholesterol transport system auxiliary component
MSVVRLALLGCAALLLAACGIGKPVPHTNTYVVEPPLPAAAPEPGRRPETLRMGHVRVAPAFAGTELVYRMDDVKFVSDFYNAFIAEPGPMLGTRMAEWLDRSGPFKSVSQPGGAIPARFVLEAVVTELYGDFRAGRTPAAVINVQFALVDLSSPTQTVVMERFIGRRVDLTDSTPDALVRGYGQALGAILSELSAQLAATAL